MATRDVAISAPDVKAAPQTYQVPNAQEIIPKSVTANFDGTASTTAWVPALEIVAPSGQVVSRTIAGSSVAAGGSAEVTFAPFLGPRGSNVVPSGVAAPQSFLYDFTLTVDSASIDTNVNGPFAGLLSQAFYLLEVWIFCRTDEATTGSSISIKVNNDGGANYDRIFLSGFTNAASPAGTTNVTVQSGTTSWTPAAVCGASSTANYFSTVRMSFPSYSQTVAFKTGEAVHAHPNAVAGIDPAGMLIAPQTLAWRSTAGINRFTVTPVTGGVKLKAGSRLLIYGR